MSATTICEFFVPGVPIPQGSKQGFVVQKKGERPRAIVVDTNKDDLKPWRAHVTKTAAAAYTGPRAEGALLLTAEFRMPRPASVKREYPAVKPDVDKLLRALMDGITDALTIWRDDAQVVDGFPSKRYVLPGQEPGVLVRIGEYRHHPTLEGVEA